MHASVLVALVLAAPPEGNEPHTRPAFWDQLAHPAPDPLPAVSEYPLAVGFQAAHPNNFTPDGIESYDWVVVHTMQGSYNGTISWFKNPEAVVSTQYVMRSVDGEVTQMVLDKDRAYHVGNQNRYALGIEHEGYIDDPAQWYTWATYSSSARLTRWLTLQHDIPVDRDHIAGHVELPGQSHTDPGSGWDWDLYMALIREVVLPGEIHGVVVDRSKPCILTATADTYLKRTAMPTDALNAADLCPVDAGTQLAYWHARPGIDDHHRLLMPPGEAACADGLDVDAYILAADWSALCPPEAMAAVGAAIQLDGGAPVGVGPDGAFVVTAGPGGHTVDAHADGLFEPAGEQVDLAVYPGARVVIALDPVAAPPDPTGDPDPDPTTDPTAGPTGDPGGDESSDATDAGDAADSGGLGSEASGAVDDSSGAAPTEPSGQDGGLHTLPGLPADYGDEDAPGACACRSDPAAPAALPILLAGLGLRRRRR